MTKGWSEAYGMFTDGEADMVLSFVTSPAYHIIAEEDLSKTAAIFDEGHYFFVELAGKIKGTDQPELADKFLEYVLSEEFQTAIPTSNWSFPAKTLFYSEEEAETLRKPALDEWLSVSWK